MEPRIVLLLPHQEKYQIAKFMVYMQEVTHQFQSYMYRNLPLLMITMDPIMNAINNCKWDPKEIASKHNDYVSNIIISLSEAKKVIERGQLPIHVQKNLWNETMAYVMEKLLDAYTAIKKCTTEGRAMMSLDLNELKNSLEVLSPVKPIPGWQRVHDWVKAYYLPTEVDFINWISQHPIYSLQQYQSIANTGLAAAMKKKEKQQFLDQIEEAYKKRHQQ